MMKVLIAVAILFSLFSCNYTGGGAGSNETGKLEIKERCAVFYTPGPGKLHQLKVDFGAKDFDGIVAANQQYMNEARQFITQQKVKIVPTSQYKLDFVKRNGEVFSIDLNKSKYAWEVFLFNGFDDPVKIDVTNVQEEYRNAGMGTNY
jgi:hypothetical protein